MTLTRGLPIIAIFLFLGACSNKPTIKSDVDLERLVQGKAKVLPEAHEAVPGTYFELTAWKEDASKTPTTAPSPGAAIGPGSLIACAAATEKRQTDNTGQCEITIPSGTYKLKYRQTVTAGGSGVAVLSCSGESPALCKAWVVN